MDYEKKYKEALEKARQLCAYPTTKPFISDLQDLFPELNESKDDRIRKELTDYIKRKFENSCSPTPSKKILTNWIAWLEKQDEQNPADKVEAKFKVGDWVSNGACTWRIDLIENDLYCSNCDKFTCGGDIKSIDEQYHLWTIKDAKDGDVLANDHNILILKESVYDWYTNGTPYSVKAYCGIKPNGNFEIGIDNWSFCGTLHIHPATKEQRDILFQKMKEDGYVWNEDKKELIKL